MYPSRNLRSGRFPLLLLLLALSTLFLCNVDKGYLYRPNLHDFNTIRNLAMAENLSPDHHFRLFLQRFTRPGGAPTYEMYSRFPVGGYALIKLAILPFGNDLSARILAARMLMLLLFSAAALLAFHSLVRITSRGWVALAATLAAFSSYYMLFYGDVVSVEGSVDLFAVLLAFHGMVVFVQEGRFRQLLARTFVALLLGWHVYAFLLPFLLLGLGSEAVRAWKDGTAAWSRVRFTGAAVLRSRYTALGLAALLFGAAVLGFNFANEYTAFEGQKPVTELPLFDSILMHTGLDRDSVSAGWWLQFLRKQFSRVRMASVPLVLADWGAGLRGWFPSVPYSGSGFSGPELSLYLLLLLLAVAAAAVVVRLARRLLPRRRQMPLAVLGLSGFFWALPMRHTVVHLSHDHEAVYYVGVPLVLYSLLLLYVHKRWGHGPVVGFAVAALLAFVVSAFQMYQRWIPDARVAEVQRTVMSELGAIRETTRGKVVLVLDSVEPGWLTQVRPPPAWNYYFAGSILTYARDVEAGARAADFIVTPDRVESGALLTPGNEWMFLYGPASIDDLVESYRAVYRRVVSSGDPVARSHFDVYLGDDALTFVREPCVREDVNRGVTLRVVPEDLKDMPIWRRLLQYISDHVVFQSTQLPMLFEEKCIAVFLFPDFPVSRIMAIQNPRLSRDSSHRHGWKVEIPASRWPEPSHGG